MQILAARVARADPTSIRRGVPTIDSCVELQARIGALPRRLGDPVPKLTRRKCSQNLATGDCLQLPVGIINHGLHELVGQANRVVRVLILHRIGIGTIEVHVESGIAEGVNLAFLPCLASHEFFDVGVFRIENHHLCRPPSFATRLDGSC